MNSACQLTQETPILTTIETQKVAVNGADYIKNLDVGVEGSDSFSMRIDALTSLDLCFVSADTKASASLLDANSSILASMHAQEPGYDCSSDNIAPITLQPGIYVVKITSDPDATQDTVLALSLDAGQSGATTDTQAINSNLPSATPTNLNSLAFAREYLNGLAETIFSKLIPSAYAESAIKKVLNITNAEPYDPLKIYASAYTIVNYKGALYYNKYYAGAKQCPIYSDCPKEYDGNETMWVKYDPSVEHEFSFYAYDAWGKGTSEDLLSAFPAVDNCVSSDYSIASVKNAVDAGLASGGYMSRAFNSGVSSSTKEALYREYMLPCSPKNLNFSNLSSLPTNVQLIMGILPLEKWLKYASNSGAAEKVNGAYPRTKIDPNNPNEATVIGLNSVNPDFYESAHTKTYYAFLRAAARYPYFCGESGNSNTMSITETCKRELASFIAHATQETAGGKSSDLFTWLRESGYPNTASVHEGGCAADGALGFSCPKKFQRYYGRGPKQLTHAYNYAGFSAAYFNGNYNFLITNPDLLAWDLDLFFTSALWFTMNNQPPKPSIHDVLIGRYKPDPSCTTSDKCKGVIYDSITGVKNSFNLTIEVINGGKECRGRKDLEFQSVTRKTAYKAALQDFSAALTTEEANMDLDPCFNVAFADYGEGTIFVTPQGVADPLIRLGLNTWINLSESSCQATELGGGAMVSVTAPGIVNYCVSRPNN